MATTSAERHLPVRTCIGCRRRDTADRLARCAIDPDGHARVSRVAPGRGAWVCGPDCVRVAARRGAFERAWRRRVSADALAGLADEVESAVRSTSNEHERLTTRVKG